MLYLYEDEVIINLNILNVKFYDIFYQNINKRISNSNYKYIIS